MPLIITGSTGFFAALSGRRRRSDGNGLASTAGAMMRRWNGRKRVRGVAGRRVHSFKAAAAAAAALWNLLPINSVMGDAVGVRNEWKVDTSKK